MLSFNKFIILFIAAASFSLASCNGKAEKQGITGTWKYKETNYTSLQRQPSIKEQNDGEYKEMAYTFREDKTYSGSIQHLGERIVTSGTYEVNKDELIFKVTGRDQPEISKILLLQDNTLKLLVEDSRIILVFNRA